VARELAGGRSEVNRLSGNFRPRAASRAATEFGGRPRSRSMADLHPTATSTRPPTGSPQACEGSGSCQGILCPSCFRTHPIHRRFFRRAPRGGHRWQTNPLYTPRELETSGPTRGSRPSSHWTLFWHNVSKARANAGVKRVVVCDVGEFLKAPLRQPLSHQEETGPQEAGPLAPRHPA